MPLNESNCLTDDSIDEDDVEKDPDWKKTPLYARVQKIMVQTVFQSIEPYVSVTKITNNSPFQNTTKMNSRDSQLPQKRTSDGEIKCACKGYCSSRLCTCRKNSAACMNCNCNPETCQNRDKENVSLAVDF